MQPKRILIADDHDIVRSGLRSILETHSGWEVVADADNGQDAINLIVETLPDVAIVDYSLPLFNGIEVTREIKAKKVATEILIFTMHSNEVLAKASFEAGAKAFLLKSDSKRQLTEAIEALLVHKPFFTDFAYQNTTSVRPPTSAAPTPQLSPRERMVIGLIAEGLSNKAMSKMLDISVKTVEAHRASLMYKLSIHSVAGLVRYAARNLLIEP
jgi:DNA-binding NarL/FixJ family response regulator